MSSSPCRRPIADIAYQNKAVVYAILFKAAAETLITIAADPKHLGARIGMTAVLHTWGSALTHHPHVHSSFRAAASRSTVSAGSPAGRASSCRCACSRGCSAGCSWKSSPAAHEAGRLRFFGKLRPPAEQPGLRRHLAPLRKIEWVVYAKRPFAGPEAVLAYLSRYTHRVAISNSRLIALDDKEVTFKWKDYRAKGRRSAQDHGPADTRVHPTLSHPRPPLGLPPHPPLRPVRQRRARREHRPRPPAARHAPEAAGDQNLTMPMSRPLSLCLPHCGGPMIIIETFERGEPPTARPATEKGRQTVTITPDEKRKACRPRRRPRCRSAQALPEPPVHPARPASATAKSSQIHPARIAAGQILGIQQTIATPANHPANRQIPIDRTAAPPSLIPPRFPPLRLVRHLPTEPAAATPSRQVSDNPIQTTDLPAP